MLKYRLIFGAIFSALLLAVVYADFRLAGQWPRNPWTAPPGTLLLLLYLLVIPLGLAEMQRLLLQENVRISMRICVAACVFCAAWPWLEMVASTTQMAASQNAFWSPVARSFQSVRPAYLVPTIMALALVAAFVKHTRHQRVKGAMANAGGTLLAIVYLGVLPGFFMPICLTRSAWMVLAIVAVVKAADIGAYVTGRLLGRHKLIYWLSPGKTVEGFFGGLAFSAAAGTGAAALFGSIWWFHGLIAGIILGAVGQLGDLLESLLKRDAGVKDSGRLPGFGGILDMLDSPLLAAPVAYWLLKLLESTR